MYSYMYSFTSKASHLQVVSHVLVAQNSGLKARPQELEGVFLKRSRSPRVTRRSNGRITASSSWRRTCVRSLAWFFCLFMQ